MDCVNLRASAHFAQICPGRTSIVLVVITATIGTLVLVFAIAIGGAS
jgi:hypothetical protein